MKPVSAIIILLLLQIQTQSQSTNNHMSVSEQNKELVKKVYEQALNKRNMDLLNAMVSEEYTGIAGKKGVEAFKEPKQSVIKALPDAQWIIREIIAEGDKVMVKWDFEGTSKAPFNGFVANGNKVANEGMGIYTVKNGKIISVHVLTDRLAFLQQLDVLPADISVLGKKGQVMFIDKFLVPPAAKTVFYERMRINRRFIKNLPGFIEDAAYEYTDDQGNLVCVTVAQWQSREALDKAKDAVQAEYKKQGFDAAAMFKKLNIAADRGVYAPVKD